MCRIISVVSCNDQKVILTKLIKKFTKFYIKSFKFLCISLYIASMSPKSIEIYKIYKTKPLKLSFRNVNCLLHSMNRAL